MAQSNTVKIGHFMRKHLWGNWKLKPFETTWNHLKPLETTWNHLKQLETVLWLSPVAFLFLPLLTTSNPGMDRPRMKTLNPNSHCTKRNLVWERNGWNVQTRWKPPCCDETYLCPSSGWCRAVGPVCMTPNRAVSLTWRQLSGRVLHITVLCVLYHHTSPHHTTPTDSQYINVVFPNVFSHFHHVTGHRD